MNITIYRKDIEKKGIYWSIIHRLYKLPTLRKALTPIVNTLKPDHLLIHGHKFYIDKQDTTVSQELILSGTWEIYETELFEKNIKPGDTVIDIGAHIGYYTLLAAKIVGKDGRVYAFEPDPKNFHLLKKNVQQNGYRNVILVNKALAERSGKAQLFINEENTGDHRIFRGDDNRDSVSIQTTTLDDFFKAEERIDFIKMDIQGAELQALQGGKKLIDRSKYLVLITEFWPKALQLSGSRANEYLMLLQKFGFKLYNIDEVKNKLTQVTSKQLLLSYSDLSDTGTNILCKK